MAVRIVSRQPLTKGWSTDQKYKVQLEDGRLGLLRIAERPAYEAKQLEFQLVENLFGLGLPVAEPLSFGRMTCQSTPFMNGWKVRI